MLRPTRLLFFPLLLFPSLLPAQTSSQMTSILERLDRLERENQSLTEQVQALRSELTAARGANPPAQEGQEPPATVENRLDVDERRIDEQQQSKVEASQKFPIRLTGTALFNAFTDSKQNGGVDYPFVAAAAGPGRAGATIRQSILGLEFLRPQTFWGGKVRGSVYMDFASGAAPLAQTMRLRTGSIEVDWYTRSVMVGIEKPIFNPREPSSLAQVAVSPLTGAGNLWLWIPQVRVEQSLKWENLVELRAQLGVVQTREVGPYAGSAQNGNLEGSRPGLEGRFEFAHKFDDERRIEIAPGFHVSTTHAAGFSIPSQVFSLDWLIRASRWFDFTGAFYSGQNVALLGAGYRQGFGIYGNEAYAVHSRG